MMNLWSQFADAEIIDLSQPMFRGMPQSPNHPTFRMVIDRRHGDAVSPTGGSGANEMIITGCHVGTHIDALSHTPLMESYLVASMRTRSPATSVSANLESRR